MNATVNVHGRNADELADALEQAANKVREGYTLGSDGVEAYGYNFEVSGEEQPIDEED